MEFQQLEMFVAVVETGSVSRGAERIFRTAPAVNVALRKLENEMCAPLFDRSERYQHRLTAAGKLLYSYATRILAMRSEATASIKDLANGRRGSLRLGTHESTSLYLLPSLLHTFNAAHPGLKAEVVCGNSERLLAALAKRHIELALLGDAPDDPELERHFIMCDELVLITSPEHRLAGFERVDIRDLAGEFLIVEGTKSLLRERFEQAFRKSDTPFNVSVENIAIEAIKRMVAKGLGVGFVPSMCVREELAEGKLAAISVDAVPNEWNLWLVHYKNVALSPAAQSFVQMCPTIESPKKNDPATTLRDGIQDANIKKRRSLTIDPGKVVHC